MADLTIHYPDDLLANSGKPKEAVERELTLQLAARLFEIGQLSLGRAANLAGLPKASFREELGRLKIPLINLDESEIEAELRASRGDYSRR